MRVTPFLLLWLVTRVGYSQTDCKLRKDKGGIKVYTCNTDTSKFKSIKVECEVRCSLDKLQRCLLDFENYTQWQFNTVESRAIKKISDSEFIYYAKVEAPWPASDRDMVMRFRSKRSENHLDITAATEGGFLDEKERLVRVPVSNVQWIITEKNKDLVEIKYSIQIDPGGSVPAWLVNWLCVSAPFQSFQALKNQNEKIN